MDIKLLQRVDDWKWRIQPRDGMLVPGVIFADEALLRDMDHKVYEQVTNVARLPGIVNASYAMPDAHWGYGFPIGGVAAFDPEQGGVVSAGGVGFDISCGVRILTTGLRRAELEPSKKVLADALYSTIPAGLGSRGSIHLDDAGLTAMLKGGASWAVEQGWGDEVDLERIEEQGCMADARPECVSPQARHRQRNEMGTLGSGNHYLEVQEVSEIFDAPTARGFGLHQGEIVVSIHCGSRGLGHQIGSEFLKRMAAEAQEYGIRLPDRELACAPLDSVTGREYLGAMRAATNCALANREIITHLTRQVFADLFPGISLTLLYDVSHNTCKEEVHEIDGRARRLFVHRKGATRALGPGSPMLPRPLRDWGQPVLIGGSMGTTSHVLVGTQESESLAFSSACHGAGRAMSRRQALKQWRGRQLVDQLAERGILIRSPSSRGVAEEAPGAYKDVDQVVNAAHQAGLARRVVRLSPLVCIKG
jgi:tRNA-splicing ligase RtcB (3'-phosphate/5'-hydroxy nucleic acid ligase)